MKPAEWTAEAGPVGPERVEVNGQDHTPDVEWFEVVSPPGGAPVLRLHLRPGAPAVFYGPGVVEVVEVGDRAYDAPEGDTGANPGVLEFLSSVNPASLAEEVWASVSPGDEDVFVHVLRCLERRAMGTGS